MTGLISLRAIGPLFRRSDGELTLITLAVSDRRVELRPTGYGVEQTEKDRRYALAQRRRLLQDPEALDLGTRGQWRALVRHLAGQFGQSAPIDDDTFYEPAGVTAWERPGLDPRASGVRS